MKLEVFFSKWHGLRWLRIGNSRDLLACRCLLLFLASFVLPATRANSQIIGETPYFELFQYAIFYNANLEIDPGAVFPITGPVFCNEGIWSGSSNPTYASYVEAVGQVNTSGTDPWLPTYTDSGTPAGNFSEPPISGAVPALIDGFGTNNLEAMLNLPPTAVRAPQDVAYTNPNISYTFNAASLIVSNWSNGMHSNTPVGNNFSVYLQDYSSGSIRQPPISGHWTQLTNDFYVVTNNSGITITTNTLIGLPGFSSSDFPVSWSPTSNLNITWKTGSGDSVTNWGVEYAGWSFLTNVSFYDYREGKTVQAVQIVVSNLDSWVLNSGINGGSNWNYALWYDTDEGIDSIYVYNDVSMTSSQLPAVRMIGGIQLPHSTNTIIQSSPYALGFYTSGLTVATPQPLYIAGDYNLQVAGDPPTSKLGSNDMSHTYPAALMADAITVLSDTWHDQYTASTSLPSRTPTTTAITAACIMGNVPSTTNYPNSFSIDGFSGGVENSLRLLENWSGSTALTYNGSLCVLFPSQYATNFWQETGNYYNAPTRVWSFDTNFWNLDYIPALTPLVINSNIAPSIIAQPTNEIVLVNQNTNMTVTASGVPSPNYQWSFDGTNIIGVTNAVLALDDLQLTNAGKYAVQVTNVFGSLASSNAILSVYASAVPAVGSSSFSASNGFQFQISGVPGYSYVIQISSDLVNWQTIYTNTSPFSFLDTNAVNEAQEFYRVVYLP